MKGWWRILAAIVLPPVAMSAAVAARYIFHLRGAAIDLACVLSGIAVGALLLRPMLRRPFFRWAVFLAYAGLSAVLSLAAGLATACRFGDCL